MRLCYVANPNSLHTRRWIRYFAEQGHEVYLIGEHATQRAVPSGVTFFDLTAQINVRKIRYLAWPRTVRQIVRRVQPDVLHAHQITSAGWLGAAAGYHPFVVTAWGSDLQIGPRRFWTHRQLARWVLRQADYVTCVSENLARAARSLGADPTRLEVAPWGVNTAVFRPGPANPALRTELGLGPGPIVLGMRAMRPVYNPLDVARAIPLVLQQVPKAQFIIRSYAYDWDLLTQFRRTILEHGATEAVHYVGDLPDDHAIADLYRLADVAVSVPSSDGTPLSVLEALACGVALVLSDLPSLREWVHDQREGLFVPTGDVQAIGAAITRLLSEETLRKKMRASGPILIQERADSRMWMARAEEMYQRVGASVTRRFHHAP